MRSATHVSTPLALIAALLLAGGRAEAQTTARATPCEDEPAYRQFDFWIGHWEVHNNANGNLAGTNHIERLHGGCVLAEHWTSASGGTGSSLNYYDGVTKQWRQVWVANGYSIDIVGGLDDAGAMALVGEIHYYRQNRSLDFRGTWTPVSDDEVRQLFEQKDPETGAWTVWFDGRYERRDGAAPADRGNGTPSPTRLEESPTR